MDRRREIGFEIKTLSHLIKRRVDSYAAECHIEKLTGMQGWIIGYLYDHTEEQKLDVFQRDIEAEFSIRRSTATGILQLMEKKGLIRREPVASDARLKKLTLTPRAVEHHQAITRMIQATEARLSNGLTDEEVEAFFAIAEKIKKNVE